MGNAEYMGSAPATMRSAAVFLLVIGLTLGKKVSIDWNPTGSAIEKCVDVGDEVEFNWDGNNHNVIQVSTEADYNGCNIPDSMKEGMKGPGRMALMEKGDYFFVCGVSTHCKYLNQKAKISTNC